MKCHYTEWLVVFAIGAAWPARDACGQVGFQHWTIETMAAQAHTIFRGAVVGITALPNFKVTVHVDEVLKGQAGKTVQLEGSSLGSFEEIDGLRKSQAELLCIIPKSGEWQEQDRSTMPPGMISSSPTSAIFIRLGQLPIAEYGMDFTAVKTPWEAIERVRKFAAITPRNVRTINFLVPNSLKCLVGNPKNYGLQRMVLPVLPELEPVLIGIINSPGSILASSHDKRDEVWIAGLCIRALAYFKSEKNIQVLKGLLSDSGIGYDALYDLAIRTRYDVRYAAYRVLSYWGVNVPKPEFDQ